MNQIEKSSNLGEDRVSHAAANPRDGCNGSMPFIHNVLNLCFNLLTLMIRFPDQLHSIPYRVSHSPWRGALITTTLSYKEGAHFCHAKTHGIHALNLMNLQQLYYFQKIAECQQYTLAAKELHVTQATLSYAITNLEKELNVQLFIRKGKTVSLTECGKAYLNCVRDALNALERGNQMVKDATAPAKAIIKLDYLESVKHLALSMASDLSADETCSDFRFQMSSSDASKMEQRLIRREIDLAISTAPTTEGITSLLIGYQDNVIITPKEHPFSQLSSVPLSALDHQRFIAYNQECMIRGYYDSILKSAHVSPDIFAESRSHNNILDMVSYGMGISIVPRMHYLQERYDLLSLPIKDEIPPRAIYLLWVENAMLPKEAELFRQKLVMHPNLSMYI